MLYNPGTENSAADAVTVIVANICMQKLYIEYIMSFQIDTMKLTMSMNLINVNPPSHEPPVHNFILENKLITEHVNFGLSFQSDFKSTQIFTRQHH